MPAEAKRWILQYLKDVGADCVEEVYQLEESGWEFTRVLWIENGFELEGVDSQGTEQAIFFPESKWEGGEPWEFPAWQEDGEEEEWEQGDDGEWWRGSWSEEEQDVEWKNSEKRLKKKRKASAETGVGGVLEKQPGGHSEEEPKKKRRKKKKASAETGGHAEETGNRAQAVRAEAVPSGPIGEEEAKKMGNKKEEEGVGTNRLGCGSEEEDDTGEQVGCAWAGRIGAEPVDGYWLGRTGGLACGIEVANGPVPQRRYERGRPRRARLSDDRRSPR